MAVPNFTKTELMKAGINLVADTIKVALLTSLTLNVDTQQYFGDVNAAEVANGNGYTTGGATLANKAVTQDNTNDRAVFDADDVTFANATITARWAVIYKSTGNNATSQIIRIIDFGSNQSSSGGNFTLQWDAVGILTLG